MNIDLLRKAFLLKSLLLAGDMS